MSFTITCESCKQTVPPEELVGLDFDKIPKTCAACRGQKTPTNAKE